MTKPIPYVFELRIVLNGKSGQTERSLTVGLPPSANVYWRFAPGQAKPYPSAKATAYKDEVGWACREAGWEPYQGGIALKLHLFLNHVDRDTSNCVKILEDALQGHAYDDDNQVAVVLLKRSYDYKNPRVEITLWQISSPEEERARREQRSAKRGGAKRDHQSPAPRRRNRRVDHGT
jgi:crossover junction endodeoxyribonuclease RusA